MTVTEGPGWGHHSDLLRFWVSPPTSVASCLEKKKMRISFLQPKVSGATCIVKWGWGGKEAKSIFSNGGICSNREAEWWPGARDGGGVWADAGQGYKCVERRRLSSRELIFSVVTTVNSGVLYYRNELRE